MQALIQSCFAGITCDEPIIVAVSGGSDSVALMLLANIWAEQSGAQLQIVTIDHGLRPEAAAEAGFVAGVAAGLGLDHVVLAWDGEKPFTGIQQAARYSRYELLADFAREIGADTILTGHTLDDQAETVLMRARRNGSNDSHKTDGRGLSGMAPLTHLLGGIKLYRPLLSVSGQSLRYLLGEFSQSWIEDPSNLDQSYERVRLRDKIKADPELAVKALALAHCSARLRSNLAEQCALWLEESVGMRSGPVFEIALKAENKKADMPEILTNPVARLGLQTVLALAGGGTFLPSWQKLRQIGELFETGAKARRCINLAGAIVEIFQKEKQAKLLIYRENRNIRRSYVEPGDELIFDGRFEVRNDSATPIVIETAGQDLITRLEAENGRKFCVEPRAALYSSPAIYFPAETSGKSVGKRMNAGKHMGVKYDPDRICLPMIDDDDGMQAGSSGLNNLPNGIAVRLCSPAIEHFCPQFDVALKNWVQGLDQHRAASLQSGYRN